MYEGQPIICQNIIEENWLEFLGFIKKQEETERQLSIKRQEALAGIDGNSSPVGKLNEEAQIAGYRHYYDISINGFWNWYITNKV